jgi:hypothetical protein
MIGEGIKEHRNAIANAPRSKRRVRNTAGGVGIIHYLPRGGVARQANVNDCPQIGRSHALGDFTVTLKLRPDTLQGHVGILLRQPGSAGSRSP